MNLFFTYLFFLPGTLTELSAISVSFGGGGPAIQSKARIEEDDVLSEEIGGDSLSRDSGNVEKGGITVTTARSERFVQAHSESLIATRRGGKYLPASLQYMTHNGLAKTFLCRLW